MACEYCNRNYSFQPEPDHTLYNCQVILPIVERHHLLNMNQAHNLSVEYTPQYTVNDLTEPLLRCLAKRLGSSMNRNLQSLRIYCIHYYNEKRRIFLRFQQAHPEPHLYQEYDPITRMLSIEFVSTQPIVVLQQNPVLDVVYNNPRKTCCICLENDTYIETNCKHAFCICIVKHLSKNGVLCPMCRQPVTELNHEDVLHLDKTMEMLPMFAPHAPRFVKGE